MKDRKPRTFRVETLTDSDGLVRIARSYDCRGPLPRITRQVLQSTRRGFGEIDLTVIKA